MRASLDPTGSSPMPLRSATAHRARWFLVFASLTLAGCEASPKGSPGPSSHGTQGGSNERGAGRPQAGGDRDGDAAGANAAGVGAAAGADEPGFFESDLPGAGPRTGGTGTGAGIGGVAGGGGTTGGGLGSASTADSGGAQRAIIEADIVQMSGDRLYALSRVAGLSVIDIARPSALRLLGTHRELPGTPFEMYLRDGVAVVMFSRWGQYERQSDGSYRWMQTSKVLALDVADPAAIERIGSFDIAGDVDDSRLVGDVLYVVGHQDGMCWGCPKQGPLTTVLSLDLADPRAIRHVDELEFPNSGGRRSVTVTAQRIYLGGPELGSMQPGGSTIQVVDITDASGDLVQGSAIAVAGRITSRWQVDEYQGVLRVVSQPWLGASSTPPRVQTYRVASSQSLTPLGSTDLQLPPNEELMSVRFDGPRGYAATTKSSDPLLTLDLSDPAQPRQAGKLALPGSIYYVEPRGERLIGLGYDQNDAAGAITVSLFDVSNLANPRMSSRVNFGAQWAHLPDDQDRIHKSFKVFDQLGLILVPFTGTSSAPNSKCPSADRSGIQLVDFAGDALTARGVVPARGEARRALVHGSSLLAISDEAVDAFDLGNRAAPAAQGRLTIARNVSRALLLTNGHVARLNQDWYAQRTTLDIAALDAADRADLSVGEVDLSEALAGEATCGGYSVWGLETYAAGTQVEVRYNRETHAVGAARTAHSGVVVIDAADPTRPVVLSKLEWPYGDGSMRWGVFSEPSSWRHGYIGQPSNTLRTERALVMLEHLYLSTADPEALPYQLRLHIVDLRDPRAPSESTLMLPVADGYPGLLKDGDAVLFNHYERNPSNGRVRFYVTRVDLSDPKSPQLLAKLNVPGALIHYDRDHGRALTSELIRTTFDATSEECDGRFAYTEFTPSSAVWTSSPGGVCTGFTQRLHLVRFVTNGVVLENTHELGARDLIATSSMSAGRVVAVLSQDRAGWRFYASSLSDCWGRCGFDYFASTNPTQLLVVGGLAEGRFEVGRLTVDDGADAWWGFYGSPPVYAFGTRALLLSQQDAAVIDTSVASEPRLLRAAPLFGYPQSVGASGNLALLALGTNGVQRVEL
jgi:hypothetical protein